jgi:hypothetical protein
MYYLVREKMPWCVFGTLVLRRSCLKETTEYVLLNG